MGIAMYRKIQKKYEYSDGVHGLMQDLHFHEGGVLTMPKHWGEKFKEGDEVIITLSTKPSEDDLNPIKPDKELTVKGIMG